MVDSIELFWAKKFRELCDNPQFEPIDVIAEFHKFCSQEEQALADRWTIQFHNMHKEYNESDHKDKIEFPKKK